MSEVSVVMGSERWRHGLDEDRVAILAEALAPGTIVADVSRRLGVATSLMYRWQRQAVGSPGFVPAVIVDEGEDRRGPASTSPVIVVELVGGPRVCVGESASASLVTAALKALK